MQVIQNKLEDYKANYGSYIPDASGSDSGVTCNQLDPKTRLPTGINYVLTKKIADAIGVSCHASGWSGNSSTNYWGIQGTIGDNATNLVYFSILDPWGGNWYYRRDNPNGYSLWCTKLSTGGQQ